MLPSAVCKVGRHAFSCLYALSFEKIFVMRHLFSRFSLLLLFSLGAFVLLLQSGCPASPTTEQTTEQTAEQTTEITTEQTAEPAIEQTAEPAAEPTAEPTAEPAAEPTAEPATEPTAEPIAEASNPDAGEPMPEGNGDAAPQECSFNKECPSDQRCECDENTGCFCMQGARGTGKNGVDTCTTGNDCESSVCVEGQGDTYYCSDECQTNADCGAALPQCLDVAFVGRICVRQAP